jgi:RND family efflux transporter MFP subunit
MGKRAVIGGLVLAGVFLLLYALLGRDRAPEITLASVVREDLSATITTNGQVEPVEPFLLRSRLETFVENVLVTAGQAVRAGDLLLTLDAAAARAELARARQDRLASEELLREARSGGSPQERTQLENDIRKSGAELARLGRERDALRRLIAKKAATQDELDRTELLLTQAESQARLLSERQADLERRAKVDAERAALALERAQNNIRELEAALASAELRSPVSGTVYLVPVKAKDFVRKGDVLAEVGDLSRVRVRAFVDEPELAGVETGQAVEITWEAMPGKTWQGRTESAPRAVVARGSRSVGEVLCAAEGAGGVLLPYTNVNVFIRTRVHNAVLTAPRAAVQLSGNSRIVFLFDSGLLRRREVKVGMASANKFEILEGLKEGDRIALSGNVELRDGMSVRASAGN